MRMFGDVFPHPDDWIAHLFASVDPRELETATIDERAALSHFFCLFWRQWRDLPMEYLPLVLRDLERKLLAEERNE